MSRFSDAMTIGGEAIMLSLANPYKYWPAGVEDDAIDIDAIMTPGASREEKSERGMTQVSRGELQVWVADVPVPNLKADIVVVGGAPWRVVEIMETTGSIHRLAIETDQRGIVGRRRGWR